MFVDLDDTPLQRCFYTEELQRTLTPNDYLMEKLLRKRGNRLYIKWLGLPTKTWINASDVLAKFTKHCISLLLFKCITLDCRL